MSVETPADSQPDRCGSRPSKNNRQEGSESLRPEFLEPSDLPECALRPLSVSPGTKLRDEAVLDVSDGTQARQVYRVLNEWRDWYADYRSMHIEYTGPEGETVRTQLENSYQPQYGKRYYAKLKDLERGMERTYNNLTTVMLTFSASNLNEQGLPRCPADHMREIAEGWRTARKQLHHVLDGYDWEYARIWEPHESGYGHLHVAVFIDGDDLDGEQFRPVMESYVGHTTAAGSEAHGLDLLGLGDAVSVNDDVQNLGTYISEYIGVFGEDALDRPVSEQMFYATTWATGTRRVDFSNGAHDIMGWSRLSREFEQERGIGLHEIGVSVGDWVEFRSDRGREMSVFDAERAARGEQVQSDVQGPDSAESRSECSESDGGGTWYVDAVCTVRNGEPEYSDPTSGGKSLTPIDGRPGLDPPRRVD